MPKPPSKHRRAIVREQLANPQRTKSRAQIAAGLASLRAELQGRAMPAERPAPKPRHLTGDALSAARASVGIGA